jgi:hypothetical protein
MKAFPFTAEDWARVSAAAGAVVNATFADDAALHATCFQALCRVLSELRDKYGPHPVLLETEADFADDPAERVALYEKAKHIAQSAGLVTYSICLSLARVLLEELGDHGRAMKELVACQELATCGDESERREWHALHAECVR